MRIALRIVLGLVLAGVVFLVIVFGASELGGELVTLHTRDASGADKTTHLWVVDDAGYAWLRAGVPSSGWLTRIEADPEVTVVRGGESHHFKAVPVHDPVVRDRIHALMREHYPVADRIVSAIRDGTKSVPVRLEPEQSPAP
jgi:hypothetical protein